MLHRAKFLVDMQDRYTLREARFFDLSPRNPLDRPIVHLHDSLKLRERYMTPDVEHDALPIYGWQGDCVLVAGRNAHANASSVIAKRLASVSL